MRCRNCDYPLWNLKARECPECGAEFLPSEYEFVPRSVQFCCPHCDQAYIGTDERGHLKPAGFNCTGCDRRINIDETVLRPVDAKSDSRTKPGEIPWVERRTRGRAKALIQTVFYSMFTPDRLGRGVTARGSTAEALVYGLFILAIAMTAITLWYRIDRLNPLWDPWMFSQIWIGDVRPMIILALLSIAAIMGIVGFIPAWALISHTLLRATGGTRSGADRTMQAISYTAGAGLPAVVPCVGPVVAALWWTISATIAVYEAQRVHPLRAVLAVSLPPFLLSALVFGGSYAALSWEESRYAQYMTMTADASGTQQMSAAVTQHSYSNNMQGPEHAIELISSQYVQSVGWAGFGPIRPFCAQSSRTSPADIPVTDEVTVQDFLNLSRTEQLRITADVLDALPPNLIAHRFGDFIFVHHEADLTTNDPQLWTVIMMPDPGVNGPPTGLTNIAIGLNDYTVREIPFSQLAGEVAKQNQYRALLNLPPLPDLTTVTHGNPAISSQTEDAEVDDAEDQ